MTPLPARPPWHRMLLLQRRCAVAVLAAAACWGVQAEPLEQAAGLAAGLGLSQGLAGAGDRVYAPGSGATQALQPEALLTQALQAQALQAEPLAPAPSLAWPTWPWPQTLVLADFDAPSSLSPWPSAGLATAVLALPDLAPAWPVADAVSSGAGPAHAMRPAVNAPTTAAGAPRPPVWAMLLGALMVLLGWRRARR